MRRDAKKEEVESGEAHFVASEQGERKATNQRM
jgi:hypothetical protein